MKWLTPYRLAAYLLVLFCAGHTAGGMLAQQPISPEADAVFAMMKSVKFEFHGGQCSWYGFWLGFGLMVSAFLLLSAVIAWQLDRVPPAAWKPVAPIAWALFASHLVNVYLSWRYFFPGPGVFSTLIVVLLGVAAWRKGRLEAA
jgi:hypothetical protein